MTSPVLKPVGQRPRCLHCERELRPNFDRPRPPLHVQTGEMVSIRKPASYGRGEPEYDLVPGNRSTTDAEQKQFKKDHPPVFMGTYGDYRDSRFCGLRCGYQWAVAHTKPQA